MAFHLLERNREGGERLARVLASAMEHVGRCDRCRTFTERERCRLCENYSRDGAMLCVVESPSDLAAIEQGTDYRGLYFVLMGNLSPLDGIGPREIGLDALQARLAEGEVKEVILATSATVEGEATAHYIGEMARGVDVRATRIAQGVPVGGELEFVNSSTLAHAFSGRRSL